jgi:hypothetical protein
MARVEEPKHKKLIQRTLMCSSIDSQGEAVGSLTSVGRCGGLTTLVLSLFEHCLDHR